jgi:hypothetical protein
VIYAQLAAFPVLATFAVVTGRRCARCRHWWIGVAVPLALFGLVIAGHRSAWLRFTAPISWAIDADWEPLLMTAAIGTVFSTLLPKLPRRRTRAYVAVAMAFMLVNYGLLPAALPLVARVALAGTATTIDHQGICLQSHNYTCGPAAAVTCLARLGVRADEATLAVDSRCAPALGTDGHLLAAAVMRRYPDIHCIYRYVEMLENLRPPAVTDMYLPRIGGHYVAVLEIRPETVLIGDPLSGLAEMPRSEFLSAWTHGAIEFSNNQSRH